MKAYFVEVGILLPKDNAEYDAYSQVYDKAHGFYDENQFYRATLEEAEDYAKEYVEIGNDTTYGIVSESEVPDDFNFDEAEIEELYDMESVVYSVAKIDNKVTENFLQ